MGSEAASGSTDASRDAWRRLVNARRAFADARVPEDNLPEITLMNWQRMCRVLHGEDRATEHLHGGGVVEVELVEHPQGLHRRSRYLYYRRNTSGWEDLRNFRAPRSWDDADASSRNVRPRNP